MKKATNWDRVFVNHTSDTGLVPEYVMNAEHSMIINKQPNFFLMGKNFRGS